MKQVIRNVTGILGITLIGSLLLPMGASAAISGNSDGSTYIGKATTITTENVSESKDATQPTIVADGCWIYLAGYWIYICNHDEVPVGKL